MKARSAVGRCKPFRMFHTRSGLYANPLTFQKPHLILFVDVNGTIIAGDTERNKDRATSIKHMLSEWTGVWDSSITAKAMPYWDFVNDHLIDTDDQDERRRQRDAYFENFLDFLKETKHPLYDDAVATFKKADAILSEDEYEVFPSFTNMILELEKREQPYSLIFRSFGSDTSFVLKEIEEKTGIKFDQHLEFDKGCLVDGDNILVTPEQMLEIVKPGLHGKWNDDFKHWDGAGRTHTTAKPYPLDSSDLANTVTMFFDDNTLDKPIIKVCDTNGKHCPHTEQEKIQQQMIEEGRLVHLETLDAILDPDHYIKYVDKALAFREKLLEKQMAEASNEYSIKRLT